MTWGDRATARGRMLWTRFPSSRSQSGMREGDDIHWDDGATARGRAPWKRFPSSRSQSGMRAGDNIRQDDGATAGSRAPLRRLPSSCSHSGTRAGDDDCGTSRKWAANQRRGQLSQRNALGRVDPQKGPP